MTCSASDDHQAVPFSTLSVEWFSKANSSRLGLHIHHSSVVVDMTIAFKRLGNLLCYLIEETKN